MRTRPISSDDERVVLGVGGVGGRVRHAVGFAVLFLAIGVVFGIAGRDLIRNRTLGGIAASVDESTRETIGTSLSAEDLLTGHIRPAADRTAHLQLAFSQHLAAMSADRVSVWNRQHWRVFALDPRATTVVDGPHWQPGSDALETALLEGRTSFEIRPRSERRSEPSEVNDEVLSVAVPVSDSASRISSTAPIVVGAVEVELDYLPIGSMIEERVRLFWGALTALLLVPYGAIVTRPIATNRRVSSEASLVTMVIFDTASGGLHYVVAGDGWLAPVVDMDASAEDLAWWSDLVLDDRSGDRTELIDVRGQEELV